MAAIKSFAAIIQENEFWLRLSTFLHEPLKNALLSVLHNASSDSTYDGLSEDPILLYRELDKQRTKIVQLLKRKVLQQDQVDLLLPPNDNKTFSKKFDTTLIVILIINFTTLRPPINGWKDKNPPAHDRSKGAGVIRGRQWRNYVHHTEPKDVDQGEFNKKWIEGTQIITDLGYQFNVNKLKTISLDPKQEVVLKSLFSFIARLQAKQDSLEAEHESLEAKLKAEHYSNSKLISGLTQQWNDIANEIQHFQMDREQRKDCSTTETGSCCLKSVLVYIAKEIKVEEAEELLVRLDLQADGDLLGELKLVPWKNIRTELEMLGRTDMVEHIRKNTLITRGLQNASDKLRDHYKIELIECLVEQPLSSTEVGYQHTLREDIYINLVVLPSVAVDEEWSNSDRDCLMKQNLLERSSRGNAVDKIIDDQDELIFIRGVAGIGKSNLIDMFTLKWAKKELCNPSSVFDFVFKFTCKELNQTLTEFGTLEELFKQQYADIFCNMTLEDLNEVFDRVLVIVDGLDELKDIYQIDCVNELSPQSPFLQAFCDLVNPKYMKSLTNHKTIVCGRPKACEFVKNQISTFKIKTIEVCGFNNTNVQNYILNFFDKNQEKAKIVQDIIASSYNLKVMSTVPVFLWVICNVYSEDLIESKIDTNTELYFYACLIFLRNHLQGFSKKYKNLLDMVNDQVIVDVVYSLMLLSVKTYMQNQVLFTDEDIKKLRCPVHLEQTGFIVKYSRSNIRKSFYQFRHLVLQEFLCSMYLCVTKGISPFLLNRELSSCLSTILGIHRIIQEGQNEIFLQFYEALRKSNQKLSNFFAKVKIPFRNLSYDNFIKKYHPILKLPHSMVKKKTLIIKSSKPSHCEFLDAFKETNNDIDAPWITEAAVRLYTYTDFKNIFNVLEKLNITKIRNFSVLLSFDEHGNIDEDILRLYALTAGSCITTEIFLGRYGTTLMHISGEELRLILPESCDFMNISLPDIIKTKVAAFKFFISDSEWFQHSQVQTFIQEIAKYAVENCKTVNFYFDPKTTADAEKDSIVAFLEDANINIDNEYVTFS